MVQAWQQMHTIDSTPKTMCSRQLDSSAALPNDACSWSINHGVDGSIVGVRSTVDAQVDGYDVQSRRITGYRSET
jgi:hypothetical protein